MDLTPYLLAWRTTGLRDREVIDALVVPSHAGPPPSAQLTQALAAWPGRFYWSTEPDGRHLVLYRRTAHRTRNLWWLHALLLVATLFTTTYAGAMFRGIVPPPGSLTQFALFIPVTLDALRTLAPGLVFALPLLAILLCHELGHYLTARHYQLDVSPPYFIPVPLWPNFIGTMGAFIRLRTIVSDRRQLFDVGVAGPIAGFVVAVPVLWYGLRLSAPLPPTLPYDGLVLWIGSVPLYLGDSLVTLALRQITGTAAGLSLHPLAFAGWMGMFVTMLNLLPIAQLDGGHILFAALPRWHERIALIFWLLLAGLGWYAWQGWLYWGILILLLSRGRLGHPPVLDAWRPLPRSRRSVAWTALALFLVTFAPVPLHF